MFSHRFSNFFPPKKLKVFEKSWLKLEWVIDNKNIQKKLFIKSSNVTVIGRSLCIFSKWVKITNCLHRLISVSFIFCVFWAKISRVCPMSWRYKRWCKRKVNYQKLRHHKKLNLPPARYVFMRIISGLSLCYSCLWHKK